MSNIIEIVELFGKSKYEIIPSKIKREWMSGDDGNPYKCKPMNVANTYGWSVLCPANFTATWNGGEDMEDISIYCDDSEYCQDCLQASSHFGLGILTFKMDFIIRTPENISTYVTHPANMLKEYVQPLDAIVETDWLPYTFTYNFKFISPGTVNFKKGEILYNFFPIQRGFIESFETKVSDINDYPEFQDEFEHFNDTRILHNNTPKGYEKDLLAGFYKRGENSLGKKYNIKNYSKTTILKNFRKGV
jgi:hypothetical protein